MIRYHVTNLQLLDPFRKISIVDLPRLDGVLNGGECLKVDRAIRSLVEPSADVDHFSLVESM